MMDKGRRDSTKREVSIGSQKRGSPSAGAVYRKAAKIVEDASWSHYTCTAIEKALGAPANYMWSPETKKYRLVFSDSDNGFLSVGQFDDEENSKDLRVLALCFMAAIADSEK